MARKNIVVHRLVSAQSLAASFNSEVTVIRYLDNLSYQINITTSNSTGTFKVQGSNDYAVSEPGTQVTNSGTWVDLTLGGGTPSVAAANDSILINMNQLPFTAIRLVYTAGTAGTGTCAIYVVGKQIGG